MAQGFDRQYNVSYVIRANTGDALKKINDFKKIVNELSKTEGKEAYFGGFNAAIGSVTTSIGNLSAALRTLNELGVAPKVTTQGFETKVKGLVTFVEEQAALMKTAIANALNAPIKSTTAASQNEKAATTKAARAAKKIADAEKNSIAAQIEDIRKKAQIIERFRIDQTTAANQGAALKAQAAGINSMRRALEKLENLKKRSYSFTVTAKVDSALGQIDRVYRKLAMLKLEAANIFASPVAPTQAKKFTNGKKAYQAPTAKIMAVAEVIDVVNKKTAAVGTVPVLGEVTNILNAAKGVTQASPITGLLGEVSKILTAAKGITQESPITGLLGEVNKIITSSKGITQEGAITGLLGEVNKIITSSKGISQESAITGLLGEINKVIVATKGITQEGAITGLLGEITNIIISAKGVKQKGAITGLLGEISKAIVKLKEKPTIDVIARIKDGTKVKVGKDGKGAVNVPLRGVLKQSDIKIPKSIEKGLPVKLIAKFNISEVVKLLNEQLREAGKSMQPITIKLDIKQAQEQLRILLDEIKAASPQTIRVSLSHGGAGSASKQTANAGGGTGSVQTTGKASSAPTVAKTGLSKYSIIQPPRGTNRPNYSEYRANGGWVGTSLGAFNRFLNHVNEVDKYNNDLKQLGNKLARRYEPISARNINPLYNQWYYPGIWEDARSGNGRLVGERIIQAHGRSYNKALMNDGTVASYSKMYMGRGYDASGFGPAPLADGSLGMAPFVPIARGKAAAAKPLKTGVAMNQLLYQITGNTSFGARTPAVVDMAKGMGTMMALGEAMQMVGGSFHQATEYQNMMETVRQIQKNNYGTDTNFEQEFEKMKHTVRDVGVKTSFTVSDVAGAAKYLSMAGLDMETINNAIRPVANVALSGDVDLATTADKLTNILTAFNLKGKDIPHLSDALVNTFTKTNTSMLQLAESAQYAAPLASLYGIPVEEMLALIGVMGDAGIQGSMAGTTLRMMINNILSPSKKQKGWWEKSGVARIDANGRHRPITAILQDMANKIPEDQLIDYVMGQFRVTSAAGAGQLVRSMRKVNTLTASNYNSKDVAEGVGLAKMNTLKGLRAQVTSLFTEAITKGMESNQDKLSNMLVTLRDTLSSPKVAQTISSLIDLIMEIGKFSTKIVGVWLKIYETAPSLITNFLKFQFILTQIGYLAAPFAALYKIVANLARVLMSFGGAATGATIASGASTTSGIASAAATAAYVRTGMASTYPVRRVAGFTNDELIALALLHKSPSQISAIKDSRRRDRLGPIRYNQLRERYSRIYSTSSRLSRGFRAGIELGTFAMVMPKLTNIGNFFVGLLSKLAKAFGLLVSPLGLFAMAIGGLTYWAIKMRNIKQERIEKYNELTKSVDNYLGKNPHVIDGFGKNSYYGNLQLRDNSQIIKNKLSDVVYANSNIRVGDKYNQISKTWMKDMYDPYFYTTGKYKERMLGENGESSTENGVPAVWASANPYSTVRTPKNADLDSIKRSKERAIEYGIKKSVEKFPFFIRESNLIKAYAKDYLSLPKEKQSQDAYNEMKSKMFAITGKYKNYGKYKDFREIEGIMTGEGTTEEFLKTQVGQKAIFDNLNAQVYEMLRIIDNGVSNIAIIASNMQLQATDLSGKIAKFYLPLGDDLSINWEKLFANLNAMGYKFEYDFWTVTSWMVQVYEKLKQMPEHAKLTVDEFLKRNNVPVMDINGATLANFYNTRSGKNLDKKTADMLSLMYNTLASSNPNKDVWDSLNLSNDKNMLNIVKGFGIDPFMKIKDLPKQFVKMGMEQFGPQNDIFGNKVNLPNSNPIGSAAPLPTIGGKGDDKENKGGSNKSYGNHYSRNSARPTQFILNIDSLLKPGQIVVTESAQSKEIAMAMEDKIAEAVSMLTAQLTAQLSIVGQDSGSYA